MQARGPTPPISEVLAQHDSTRETGGSAPYGTKSTVVLHVATGRQERRVDPDGGVDKGRCWSKNGVLFRGKEETKVAVLPTTKRSLYGASVGLQFVQENHKRFIRRFPSDDGEVGVFKCSVPVIEWISCLFFFLTMKLLVGNMIDINWPLYVAKIICTVQCWNVPYYYCTTLHTYRLHTHSHRSHQNKLQF